MPNTFDSKTPTADPASRPSTNGDEIAEAAMKFRNSGRIEDAHELLDKIDQQSQQSNVRAATPFTVTVTAVTVTTATFF